MNKLMIVGSSVIIATAIAAVTYSYFETRPEPVKCQYPPLEDSDVDQRPAEEDQPTEEEQPAEEEQPTEEEQPVEEEQPCEHCLYTGPAPQDQKPAVISLVIIYFVAVLLLDLYLLLASRA